MERRTFLEVLPLLGVLPAATALQACSKPFSCHDTKGLSEAQVEARNAVAYSDKSSDMKRTCVKCVQFTAGETCGTCKVLAGPIHPAGTCNIFST